MFEDRCLTLEGDGENDDLTSLFTEIKRIRNELLDEILFSEDLPPTIDFRDECPGGRDVCDCTSDRLTSDGPGR